MLYYVEYGCNEKIDTMVISAENEKVATAYAKSCAENVFKECNKFRKIINQYVFNTFEEFLQMVEENIFYQVKPFDETDIKQISLLEKEGWFEV